MDNKIFIVDDCKYFIWLRVLIVAYIIIHCEILYIVTISYQNFVIYCWKIMAFIIILNKIFKWVDFTFNK